MQPNLETYIEDHSMPCENTSPNVVNQTKEEVLNRFSNCTTQSVKLMVP